MPRRRRRGCAAFRFRVDSGFHVVHPGELSLHLCAIWASETRRIHYLIIMHKFGSILSPQVDPKKGNLVAVGYGNFKDGKRLWALCSCMRTAGGQALHNEVLDRPRINAMTWEEFGGWLTPCKHARVFTESSDLLPRSLVNELNLLYDGADGANDSINLLAVSTLRTTTTLNSSLLPPTFSPSFS